jgi:hypothetical protein
MGLAATLYDNMNPFDGTMETAVSSFPFDRRLSGIGNCLGGYSASRPGWSQSSLALLARASAVVGVGGALS